MKRSGLTVTMIYLALAIVFVEIFQHVALGGESNVEKGLSLIYDPQSQKYFSSGKLNFKSRVSGDLEISVDGKDFVPLAGALTIEEEGKHTLRLRGKRTVSSRHPTQQMEVFVDRSPPDTTPNLDSGTVFEKNEILYVSGRAMVSLSVTDTLSGVGSVMYAKKGEGYTPYTGPIAIEGEGRQTLLFRATDRVGNVEDEQVMELVVDNSPPLSQLRPSGMVKSALLKTKFHLVARDAASFAIASEDADSGVKRTFYSVNDGQFTRYTKPLYFLKEGQTKLTYYSEDNVGNREKQTTVIIYTVSVPPNALPVPAGKFIKEGGELIATGDFELKFDVKDTPAGLDRIDIDVDSSGKFRPYLQPIRFARLGTHRVDYRAVDRLGNTETTKSFLVTLTETPPETLLTTTVPLTASNGVSYSNGPNQVLFKVREKGAPVARTLVSVNGQPFEAYRGPIPIDPQQRIHRISYKSVDKLGNEEQPRTSIIYMAAAQSRRDTAAAPPPTPLPTKRSQMIRLNASAEEKVAPAKPRSAPKPAPARSGSGGVWKPKSPASDDLTPIQRR